MRVIRAIKLIQAIDLRSAQVSSGLLLLAVNLFLIWPSFFPTADDIGVWDEAVFLYKGQELLDEGAWPIFSENPLTSVFYALTYLPFRTSKIWMMQSDGLGRALTFGLVWAAVWLIARQIKASLQQQDEQPENVRINAWAIPPIMLGMVVVTPTVHSMFPYSSDLLFTGLAGLSFWQLLTYLNSGSEYRSRRNWHIWFASSLLGLSALARNDGLVLFPILAALVVVINWPLRWERHWWLALVGAVLPFLLFVGGYVIFYGMLTGRYELGTMERTYANFETGQGVLYHPSGGIDANIETQLEARRLFGTPEENNSSVFKAIQRNPQVYFGRMEKLILSLPKTFLHAYAIRFAPVLLLLALRGATELALRKQFRLLMIFCLWPMHLASGLVTTMVREGHLLFVIFVIFALAALGLLAALADWAKVQLRLVWVMVLGALSIATFITNKLAIFYSTAAFLIALTVVWVSWRGRKDHGGDPRVVAYNRLSVALLVMMCMGLVLHGSFPSPLIPDQAQGARVEAVMYLSEHFPENTPVAAGSPGPVWMAKMNYLGLTSTDVPLSRTPEEFLAWMKLQGTQVIYVDATLYYTSSTIWQMIEPQIGLGLERIKTFDEGNIQILTIK